jgi:hypothetical protein
MDAAVSKSSTPSSSFPRKRESIAGTAPLFEAWTPAFAGDGLFCSDNLLRFVSGQVKR